MIRLGTLDSRATVMTLLRTRQLPRCSYTFMSSDAVSMATSNLKKIRFHSFSASHIIISTEGNLRLPTTYDNHPSIHPIHLSTIPHIAVKKTSPLRSNQFNQSNQPNRCNQPN